MYCDALELSEIRDKVVGKRLMEIYPDWPNGVLYLRFADTCDTVMVKIKNNYYAGIEIMKSAKFGGKENGTAAD